MKQGCVRWSFFMRKFIIGWLMLLCPALASAQLTVCPAGSPTTPRHGFCERPGPDAGAPVGDPTRLHPYTYTLQDNAEMLRLLDRYDAPTPRRVADCTLETNLILNEVCTQTNGEMYQCVTPSAGGASPTLCDAPGEYLQVGGSGGGSTAVLSAENCLTDITTATAGDYCCDLGTNATCYQCESPGAGGASATLCDDPGDWQPKNEAAPSGDSAQTVYNNSGATPTVNLGTNGLIYRNAVDPASSFQVCNDVAPPNDQCWQWFISSTGGPIQQTKLPSDTILKLHENFSLKVLDAADAVLFEVDEATGAAAIPGLQHLDLHLFRTDDPDGTADTCRMAVSGVSGTCATGFSYVNAANYLAPFDGQIIAMTCVMGSVPASTTYTFNAKVEDNGTTVTAVVTASNTPVMATSITPIPFSVGQRLGVTMVESGTGGDGTQAICSLGVRYDTP